MDAEEYRRRSREQWDCAAAGWEERERWLHETSAPVSAWLIDAVSLEPGRRVLELAAGTGDVGLMAAELIRPGGTLICSDRSGPMLTRARARADELGLDNVEFKLIDGERIDLPLADVDAVICRWGYMLMADPAAALRETRRVLRPGGRVSLAVWDRLEHNPWSAIPAAALIDVGLRDPPDPTEPGPFALSEPDRVRALLEDAGFAEVELDAVEMVRPDPDFETWWSGHLAMSTVARLAVADADARTLEALTSRMRSGLAPYTAADGSVAVPARTLVASASA
ncbi:MAG: class I SAM-dependent methyltransferase [Solirubrobacteraceae bacterium]